MFIDSDTVSGFKDLFRNYDLEWEFIKTMDDLYDLKYDSAIVVHEQDGNMIGFVWILVWEPCNDNQVGVV